jgi:hypothetical protein
MRQSGTPREHIHTGDTLEALHSPPARLVWRMDAGIGDLGLHAAST